ncbi:cyclin-F [Protopterus annectens]|uniref:cyclin-F n=1 Tax=Protopterus annectens TaxID=7888 RepID=UPI001CFA23D1|nr:cyclin-F [Protopterus annectens]
MKAGIFHCRCSRCFHLPLKRRLRKRPLVLGILNLPEDVLLQIIKYLPVDDILAVRAVNSYFKYIVDHHSSVWGSASFSEVWPSPDNLRLFERAAESGNFEAAVKLGIAYLYNEGLSISDEGRAEVNGLKASRFLSLAESLNVHADPFIWLFIRPPWSPTGSCCKAVVFESLRTECQSQFVKKGQLLYCLAKVLSLFEGDEKHKEAVSLFTESSNQGCLSSSFLIWKHEREHAMSDPGRNLQSLRYLRDCAVKGCWEAQMAFAKYCGNGNQLGLDIRTTYEIISRVFQSSSPCNKQGIFMLQKGMNDTMRYILIDWLVEVATMKDYSSLCLHVTVSCVDRYLMKRPVPRAKLQLLGIACMVICTRFISREILTIREAVWLTDNTYKYEDLVRMMGEIISALEGKIRMPAVVDYVDVLLKFTPVERRTAQLCYYIAELSLLDTSLSVYSPSQIAAASLLLAKILHRQALPWSNHLTDCTGFTHEDLVPCLLSLHKKCFYDDAPKDYRQVSLTAVRQRFEDDRHEQISKEKVMSHKELCDLLGVRPEDQEPVSVLTTIGEIHTFLNSPCGNKTKRRRDGSFCEDRSSFVATPTAELSSQEETLLGDFLDWSLDTSWSGYEGDQESEGEKEGDVTGPSGILDVTMMCIDPQQHCCPESSDEDNIPEKKAVLNPPKRCTEVVSETSQRCYITFRMRCEPKAEPSSGYSSVCTGSPASITAAQYVVPTSSTSEQSTSLHSSLSASVPWSSEAACFPYTQKNPEYRGQVKRKNAAEHNSEEFNISQCSTL